MSAKASSEVRGWVEGSDRECLWHRKKNVFKLDSDSGDVGLSKGSTHPPLGDLGWDM